MALNTVIVGIDPGLTGSICVLYSDIPFSKTNPTFHTTPVYESGTYKTTGKPYYSISKVEMAELLIDVRQAVNTENAENEEGLKLDLVVGVEKIHIFPGMDVKSMNKLLECASVWQGIALTIANQVYNIPSRTWKRHFDLWGLKHRRKEIAREVALEYLEPDIHSITTDDAEAFLISLYLKDLLSGEFSAAETRKNLIV